MRANSGLLAAAPPTRPPRCGPRRGSAALVHSRLGTEVTPLHHDEILAVKGQKMEAINQSNVNIVHITRSPARSADHECLVSFAKAGPVCVQATLEAGSGLPAAVEAMLAGVRDRKARRILSDEVETISAQFMAATGFRAVDATLKVVDGVMCPRWHADHVAVRCLCTWVGPGTLYVANRDADRRQMAERWPADPDEQRWFGVRDVAGVRHAGEWDLLLLKGHTAPGFSGRGAVHRSPEGASRDRPRLLLKLDEHRACGCC